MSGYPFPGPLAGEAGFYWYCLCLYLWAVPGCLLFIRGLGQGDKRKPRAGTSVSMYQGPQPICLLLSTFQSFVVLYLMSRVLSPTLLRNRKNHIYLIFLQVEAP